MSTPRDEAVIPLPMPEMTPPVITMYFFGEGFGLGFGFGLGVGASRRPGVLAVLNAELGSMLLPLLLLVVGVVVVVV